MEFMEPQFILEKLVRYPAAPHVETQEPEGLEPMTLEMEIYLWGETKSMVENDKGQE